MQTTTPRKEIRAQPGAQEAFLSTPADIAIYGGAAGGGKSFALLLEAVRHSNNPRFGGVIFRRTYAQVKNEGGLWDESGGLYPQIGAVPNSSDLSWKFQSGANVSFAHLQHESSIYNYQGAQIPFIGFDELTHFSERQFFYMLSRNRSASGVRPYVRATCNPDADSWVAEFISWWIADDGYADLSRSGKLRYFYSVSGTLHWSSDQNELMGKFPEMAKVAPPKSVTFITATIYDNKILLEKDPGYLANLQSLSHIDQERLMGDKNRGGNWKIQAEAGKVFNRAWFEIVDAVPAGGTECRFWDFAGTVPKLKGDDPDYTAGGKVLLVDGIYYVTDCIETRLASVDGLVKNTAIQDRDDAARRGARYLVRWELEPGSASIRENARMVAMMAGFDVAGSPSKGDKLMRAKAFSAQAKAGNVKLLKGDWNEGWLKHMHGQPDLPHDDMMDASAGAFNTIAQGAQFAFAIA